MINSNSIPGILPLDFRRKNNVTGLYYNITSKITLSQYITKKRLNREEFINLLINILKTLLDCRKFLLYDNSFALHEDYLFINPSSQEVFLMYLPVEQSYNLVDNLRKFTVRILVEKANFDEHSKDNFMQRILEFVREDSFTITDFHTFLNGLKCEQNTEQGINVKTFKTAEPVQRKKAEFEIQKTDNKKARKEQIHPISISDIKKDNMPERGNSHDVAENRQKYTISNPKVLAVIVQVLVIILFFIGKGYLITITGDTVSAYLGTGIILFSLDILAMRKIYDNKNIDSKALNTSKRAIISEVKIPALKEKIIS